MRIKGNITTILSIFKSMWKKQGVILLIPFVLIWGILNILNIHDIMYPDIIFSKYFIDFRMVIVLPIGIAIVLVTAIAPYLDGCGRELLYANRKYILIECIIQTICYSIIMTIEFVAVYIRILEMEVLDLTVIVYLKYLAYIFCISGIILFLGYRIKKMPIFIMSIVLIYVSEIILYIAGEAMLSMFSWKYESGAYLIEMAMLILIGVLCWRDSYKQITLYWDYDDVG